MAVRAGEPASVYSAEEIIRRSIAYHDPNGVWERIGMDAAGALAFAVERKVTVDEAVKVLSA